MLYLKIGLSLFQAILLGKVAKSKMRSPILWGFLTLALALGINHKLTINGFTPVLFATGLGGFGIMYIIMWILNFFRDQDGQSLLSTITKKYNMIRLNFINDPAKIVKLAENSPSWQVRKRATQNTYHQTVLYDIAKSDPSPKVRAQAVNQIKDIDKVKEILENDNAREVTHNAYSRLGDLDPQDEDYLHYQKIKQNLTSKQ